MGSASESIVLSYILDNPSSFLSTKVFSYSEIGKAVKIAINEENCIQTINIYTDIQA